MEDIEHIASVQLAQTGILSDSMIIFDTWLIITKVWLDVVFNRSDARVDHMIESGAVDLVITSYSIHYTKLYDLTHWPLRKP